MGDQLCLSALLLAPLGDGLRFRHFLELNNKFVDPRQFLEMG